MKQGSASHSLAARSSCCRKAAPLRSRCGAPDRVSSFDNVEEVRPPEHSKYPKLPSHLKEQLSAITPSTDRDLVYYPCLVRLNDGSELDRVYLVSEIPFITYWGVYPNQDPGKAEVLIADIASVADSPSRLPAQFANELYKAGESGMGYMVFTVVFKGLVPFLRSRRAYLTGNAVDFIDYPLGKGPKDVISVLPGVGRNSRCRHGLKYYWCLYSE